MNVKFITWCGRLLLALVFLLAAVHKILFPETFALNIYQYRLLPDVMINFVALTLPWIELVAAIAILCPLAWKNAAATLIIAMLGAFALAMSFNILRGLDITCGCFSANPDADSIGWSNVVRNLGYIVIAVVVMAEDWLTQHFAMPLRRR